MKHNEVLTITSVDIFYEKMVNNGTETIKSGDVVVYDLTDSSGRKVLLTAIEKNTAVAGIAMEEMVPGKSGNVIFEGVTEANVKTTDTDAIVIGDLLATSTTKGCLAKVSSPAVATVIAIAKEAVPVSTTKKIKVQVRKM